MDIEWRKGEERMVLSEEGKVGGVLLSKGSQSPGRRRGRVKEGGEEKGERGEGGGGEEGGGE